MSTRYYRAWSFDRSRGVIVGAKELDPQRLPRQHCRLEYEGDRLIRLEEHRPDLDLPAVKVIGYESPESSRITAVLDYNPDGTLRLIHRYCYDPLGRMVDRIELDGKEKNRGHVVSVWNEQGQEAEEIAHAPDNRILNIHRYAYDGAGRLVEERIHAPGGELAGRREIDYDERDNVVEKRWFGPDGTLKSRFAHRYDAQDNLVCSQLLGQDGEVRGTTNYTYDEVGNLISES